MNQPCIRCLRLKKEVTILEPVSTTPVTEDMTNYKYTCECGASFERTINNADLKVCYELDLDKAMIHFSDAYIVAGEDITAEDVSNTVCTAFEGGIGYWACLDKRSDFDDKPREVPTSDWISKRLLDRKSVFFYDTETELDEPHDKIEYFELTLDKLINGIQLNAKNRPHDPDIRTGDSITADCIVQYALFDTLVYG